jgi:hypothetical protein
MLTLSDFDRVGPERRTRSSFLSATVRESETSERFLSSEDRRLEEAIAGRETAR